MIRQVPSSRCYVSGREGTTPQQLLLGRCLGFWTWEKAVVEMLLRIRVRGMFGFSAFCMLFFLELNSGGLKANQVSGRINPPPLSNVQGSLQGPFNNWNGVLRALSTHPDHERTTSTVIVIVSFPTKRDIPIKAHGCIPGLALGSAAAEGKSIALGQLQGAWVIPFWGRCTTQFRTYFSGGWDVHWEYGIVTLGHMLYREPA